MTAPRPDEDDTTPPETHAGGNAASLLVDGHEILPALLADVAAARSTIHVSMFLWFRDPVGEELADALIAKAQAGVRVRVLVNVEKTAMGDPFSTGEAEMMRHDPSMDHDATDVKPMCERMRAGGVEVHDTNIDYDAVIDGLPPRLTSVGAQIAATVDLSALHIDHRKLVLVDGAVGYCGGANVGAQYMFHVPFDAAEEAHAEGDARKAAGLPEPWWKWHDSLTRFEGPIVRVLERHFRDRFLLDGGAAYELPGQGVAAPNPHVARRFSIRRATVVHNEPNDHPNPVRQLLVHLIAHAQRSIFIENPYLYHPEITGALCAAKQENPALEITLMLTGRAWNDSEFSHDAQQHEYERYLACGIEVFEYQNHFNHLKMAVVDERYSVHGSTNCNFRSLEDDNDFELVVLVDDEPLARDVLARVRDVDIPRARRFTAKDLDGSFAGFRVKHRDPRTMLLVSRRVL